MSKRIITTILLLAFLTFNLTACFDTDDLFDNVIAPDGSVPENTEKSTDSQDSILSEVFLTQKESAMT